MRTEDKTELYTRLNYTQYKLFEEQLRNWESIETTHLDMHNKFYHKALRLELGSLIIEVQGPTVKEPLKDDTIVTSPPEEDYVIVQDQDCTCYPEKWGTIDTQCPYHSGTQVSFTIRDTGGPVDESVHGETTVSDDAGETRLPTEQSNDLQRRNW